VALGVMDGLVDLQIVSGVSGGLVGSWVSMGGPGWPLGLAVDLGGSRVTLITCQFLGAKSTSIRDCIGPSVGPLVGRSVGPPQCDYVENAENMENAIASRRGGGRGN
jgi:hypothetical protein